MLQKLAVQVVHTAYRDATDGHLADAFESVLGSSSRQPFAATMAEASGCNFSVQMPDCFFRGDSCRKGAGLYDRSRHVEYRKSAQECHRSLGQPSPHTCHVRPADWRNEVELYEVELM